MSTLTTSRRSLLGALALAPIAVTSPAIAASTGTATWDRAVAAHAAAVEALKRFSEDVYDPANARVEATAPRPPLKFSVPARNGQVATFRFDPDKPHEWDDQIGPQFREGAAEQRRFWEAYKAAEVAERIDEIDDEWNRLAGESSDRWSEALLTPAPHIEAVAWKLNILFGAENRAHSDSIDCWNARYTDAIIADVQRLLGREA